MHKCENCGTEFDSKFCPNCGTPAPLEACLNCGAKLSPTDKFCPECGKPLRAPAAPQPAPVPAAPASSATASAANRAPSPMRMKFLSLLPYATGVLYALFSVLLFLMFLGPVSSVMGVGTGSIYEQLAADGGELSELMGAGTLNGVCTALVVFAALGVGYSACVLAFRFYIPLRVKKIGSLRVCTLLEWGTLPFYFADFLLGCILCGTVSDELTSPGAGAVCVPVFALLFGLCTAGILLLQKFSSKLFPAETAMLEKQKAARRAALMPPVKPEEVKKPDGTQTVLYTDNMIVPMHKYRKAKKLFVIMASLGMVLAVFTWFFGATIPYTIYIRNDPAYYSKLLLGASPMTLGSTPGMGGTLLLIWLLAVVLYFVLGGSLGAVYYKKTKTPQKQPLQILRNRNLTAVGIILPFLIFVLNLILSLILGEIIMGTFVPLSELDPTYLRGALILNAIIVALYLIGELPFFHHLLRRGRELRSELYPEEVAYRKYLLQCKAYEIQLAYYGEGIAWKKARS